MPTVLSQEPLKYDRPRQKCWVTTIQQEIVESAISILYVNESLNDGQPSFQTTFACSSGCLKKGIQNHTHNRKHPMKKVVTVIRMCKYSGVAAY